MKRNIFNQYITVSDFKGLFVSEMLWNNPTGATQLPEITIDNTTFHIEQIAERKGFQILYCQVDQIPSSAICKKIDHKIRKNAENYICIFILPGTLHHLWVAPVKKVEKRDVVLIEYDSLDKAAFLFEKMESLSFSLDDNLTILDIIEKVQAAFLINSEKITKDFYAGFKKEHSNFAKFITGIDDHIDEKENKNKQWYASVMLNRLMFCYFIQKKEFLDGDVDYLRHKLEWTRDQEGEDRFFNKFYKGFLVNLFHDGLNTPKHNHEFEKIYGRIPYLNGGMFDVHQLEREYANLDIADEAFISLFDFFDKWHWHLDDRMTASGRDINPDVLGYIFEQYINDRAQMGAYYTKEDITEYIGRNTIVPYLMATVKRKDEKHFRANSELWLYLKESGDKYIYDTMKKGVDQTIPEEIAIGLDTTKPNLLERRYHWNERTPEAFALPTEIWRETIERLQRYNNIKEKIVKGEITDINDFITYNLNIRQFVTDYLANTQNHLFAKHFYHALQHVTILDPTCGSGAFLFAALNILEPLYEVCINRMQEFNAKNPQLFKQELQEIEHKYRSNIQYFIYKSIILRNLYGVDIMVEATEIAKLRLFLKMVAVVEVDKRDPNLGLDPLPDIDFNIRCGNTLVGYATQEELERDLIEGDMYAREEFKEKVNDEMDKVSRTYEIFKDVQLHQAEDMATFKKAKSELYQRLNTLNDLLNHKMYGAVESAKGYDAWYQTHQPFHWLAEFYEIINEHGGFDVIIGNPPYLEVRQIDYKITGYKTLDSGAVHAFCMERGLNLIHTKGNISMIVPLALVCTQRMVGIQNLIEDKRCSWYSNFAWRPAKLFDAVNRALTIFIANADNEQHHYTTSYIKWAADCRKELFKSISYSQYDAKRNSFWMPKLSGPIEISILKNILSNSKQVGNFIVKSSHNKIYYRTTGGLYWKVFTTFTPKFFCNGIQGHSTRETSISLLPESIKESFVALLSSNLFWWWYTITSNLRDLNPSDIYGFKFPNGLLNEVKLQNLGKLYVEDLKINSTMLTREQKNKGVTQTQSFKISKSKPIIDEIDKVLARHYGFTEEELDFIINYDIKYRMGDELNEEK